MNYSDEINTIFKNVFGVFPDFFPTDTVIDLIQARMDKAEQDGNEEVLRYQDKFNEVTFHHGLVFESSGIRFA